MPGAGRGCGANPGNQPSWCSTFLNASAAAVELLLKHRSTLKKTRFCCRYLHTIAEHFFRASFLSGSRLRKTPYRHVHKSDMNRFGTGSGSGRSHSFQSESHARVDFCRCILHPCFPFGSFSAHDAPHLFRAWYPGALSSGTLPLCFLYSALSAARQRLSTNKGHLAPELHRALRLPGPPWLQARLYFPPALCPP